MAVAAAEAPAQVARVNAAAVRVNATVAREAVQGAEAVPTVQDFAQPHVQPAVPMRARTAARLLAPLPAAEAVKISALALPQENHNERN